MYRTISAAFWTDPKVKLLPIEAKLVFIYLITSPHSHVSGIYHLSLPYASADLRMTAGALAKTLDTLSGLGFCRLDVENSIIWVRRMFDYQGRGEKNARSAARHLVEDLHNSVLCAEFLLAYPHVKQYISEAELDRVSNRVCDTPSGSGTPNSLFPIPNSLIPNPKQKQKQKATFGQFANVQLANEEHAKLVGQFGESGTKDRIENLSSYIASKGKKYSSHYATLLVWESKNANGNGKPGAIAPFARPDLTPEEAAKFDEEIKALRATMS